MITENDKMLLAHGATPAPQPAPADDEMIDMDEVSELRDELCEISSGYSDLAEWVAKAIVPDDELTEDWEYELPDDCDCGDEILRYFADWARVWTNEPEDSYGHVRSEYEFYTTIHYYDADIMRRINDSLQDAVERAQALKACADTTIKAIDDMIAAGKVDADWDFNSVEEWVDDNWAVTRSDDILWVDGFIRQR